MNTREEREEMQLKRRGLLIYFSAGIIVLAISLGILAGCKRSSITIPTTPYTAASTPEDKISAYENPAAVITVEELNRIQDASNLVILDARAANGKDYRINFKGGHIPGASGFMRSQYTDSARWNRVARATQVQRYFREMGIDNYSRIVLYDNGNGRAGRVYWMLLMHGCENQVQILDGGIDKWKEAGYQLSNERTNRGSAKFSFNKAKADPGLTTEFKEIGEASSTPDDPGKIVVDARSADEYTKGHIANSVNVGVDEILNPDKTFKPLHELNSIFAAKGVTPDKNVYVYSNYGGRSSLVWFVLHELMGYSTVKNFDAGLKEWGYREKPLVKGTPNV